MIEDDKTLPEHVQANREYWDGMADEWVKAGETAWAASEPFWGIWHIAESALKLLPADMTGQRAVELGCGTGYVSAWMTRRGASVLGIDNSARQLETARRLAAEHALEIEFIHGNAETVPAESASFDFAISEYGAAIWCDPFKWIPEAHRLLKRGGLLTFLGSHPLAMACTPLDGDVTDDKLHRSWYELHRMDWRDVPIDPGGIEFNLNFEGWFSLFADTGFEVLRYQEPRAPEDATGTPFGTTADWARRWPVEQVWHLRKKA